MYRLQEIIYIRLLKKIGIVLVFLHLWEKFIFLTTVSYFFYYLEVDLKYRRGSIKFFVNNILLNDFAFLTFFRKKKAGNRTPVLETLFLALGNLKR